MTRKSHYFDFLNSKSCHCYAALKSLKRVVQSDNERALQHTTDGNSWKAATFQIKCSKQDNVCNRTGMILEHGYERWMSKGEKTMNSPACGPRALQQWNENGSEKQCAKYLNDKWNALHTACTSELEVLATAPWTCTSVRKAHVFVVVTAARAHEAHERYNGQRLQKTLPLYLFWLSRG